MSQTKKNGALLFVLGWSLVIVGIILTLKWWPYVVTLFKAVIGAILAITGLLILYFQKQK